MRYGSYSYRNVAVVEIDQHYTALDMEPAMISERAKGVLGVTHLGRHYVGLTDRCAYRRCVAAAEKVCAGLNNRAPASDDELAALTMAWGGSA
tara:strand:- start:26 stop:304 length:279 start_codon:yes stop_codon:yes gene_type:complete